MILVGKPDNELKGHIIVDNVFIPYHFIEGLASFEVRFSKNGMELSYQRPNKSGTVEELVQEAAIYLFGDK